MPYVFFLPKQAKDSVTIAILAEELGVAENRVRQWCRDGVRGIHLRVHQAPRGLSTTYDEYDRFCQELTKYEANSRSADLDLNGQTSQPT